MALRVSDLLNLKSLRAFRLEGGAKGLSGYISTACILDYECVPEVERLPNPLFDEGAFVISSLLFAKDSPHEILPAMQTLVKNGVRAFAYKRIFFDSLPDEVIDYINHEGLPVFSFGTDYYFENIIFEIMDAVQQDDARILNESRIQYLLEHRLSEAEALELKESLSLRFKKYVMVAYFNGNPENSEFDTHRLLRSFYHNKALIEKVMLGSYHGGIFVFMTASHASAETFRIIFRHYIEISGIDEEKITSAFSRIHPANTGLATALCESYWAWCTACAENIHSAEYQGIGTWQYIAPLCREPLMLEFSTNCLLPLRANETLMKTAQAWVNAGGDFSAAALTLHCHQNTVRYRIARIKQLITPDANPLSDFQLYEQLSTAFKIDALR